MPVKVVEADIRRDIPIFMDLLNRNRKDTVGRDRFEWLYLNNPRGPARAWIVVDEATDKPVAFTSVLPRVVRVKGQNIVCWNCCDFSVDQKYRTLGVAVKLRRMAKICVDEGQIRALYAHPNDRMKVIHQRVGHGAIGQMNRFAKVLAVEPYLRKRIQFSLAVTLMGPPANLLLRMADGFHRKDRRYQLHSVASAEPFDETYDGLYQRVADTYPVIGERTAEYLNWRFGQNPLYRTERMEIRDGDTLAGYVLFYVENGIAVFKDILCPLESSVARTLLIHWIGQMRQRGVHSISAIFENHHPLIPEFRKLGFKFRPSETSSVFAYIKPDDELAPLWMDGRHWYMTVGDRDV